MRLRISAVIAIAILLFTPFFSIISLSANQSFDLDYFVETETDNPSKSYISLHTKTRGGGITFTNMTDYVGLAGVTGDSFAWGDYNNDGYQDLLVKGGRLFKNNGPPNWDFIEVTEVVGLKGSGYAVWGDYNNDGYLDFFSVGHPYEFWDTLWMNLGPPDYKFLNVTECAGNLNDEMPGLAAGWGDYDRDSYIDLYIVNWRDDENIKYPDVLWHNNGDGTFSDVTLEAGVWEGDDPFAGMGVNWGDYNNDGWLDIYVSNYLVTPNYLYENNKDGTFTDVALEKNAAGEALAGEYYGHTAGSSWADYDHDGDLDMWISNLAHTTDPRGFYTDYSQMLRNNGPDEDYTFTDVRDETGIEKKPYMSEDELHFGIAWGDYDNDGDYDMFIPQVKNLDYAYSYFFENNGDGTFTDVSDEVGVKVWNTDGACWADYNNDGYIDLIVEGQYPFGGKREIRLFRNNGEAPNNWLEVGLVAKESNFASIGARVKASYSGITQMKEVEGGTAGHSYQNSLAQHFGFGDYYDTVDIKVWWPSGKERNLSDVHLNQRTIISAFDYDPVIFEILSSNWEPYDGDIVTLSVIVQNAGKNHIDSLRVQFYDQDVNSNPIGTQRLEDIAPGQKITAQIQWDTTDKKGTHIINVLIDDVAPRDDYTPNNYGKIEIEVRKDMPDLAISSISFSNPSPEEGETITINANIKNLGNLKTDSATITFYDEDIYSILIGVENLYDIFPGETKSAEVQWETEDKKGSHTILIIITDCIPEEQNIENNNGSKNIEVKEYEPPEEPPQPPPEEVNYPPVITEFIAEPSTILVEESCTLIVYAEDVNGDALTYTYKVSDGTIIGYGSSVLWYAPNKPGNYEISVIVKDTLDAEATESIFVEVLSNTPPTIKIASISSDTVYNNGIDTILFTVEISDENGLEDIDEVRIDLSEIGGSPKQKMNDEGKKGDKKAKDGIYSYEAVVPEAVESGHKIIRITVKDKSNGESTEEVSLNVFSSDEEEKIEDIFGFNSTNFMFLVIAFVLIVIGVAVALALISRRAI